jgi:F-type H+-transporting ATPase subunit b
MRGVAFSAVGLSLALPALAEDPHAATQDAGATAQHSPPLFAVDPGLLIWTIVTFGVVLVVLSRTAWKPLIDSLHAREKTISDAIEGARRVNSEAESLLAKYQTMLDHAKDESRAILEEARRDGLVIQEDIKLRAQKDANEFKERARREIELAKDGALKEIWDEATSLSTELATRILGRTLHGADQDRLVRELIDEMRGGMAGRTEVGQGAERR